MPGPERAVERVLVVSKTHLDVGFTDLAAQVRRRYLDDFFPRALDVAAELRARGGPERLRWTTGSWILTEALEAATPAQRARLDVAIEAGDLCWHALPFTLHTELCDRSLLEHGLSLAAALDRRYGRRTRAAKVTDVPGHTRALVSVLAGAGVDLLHVGVNPAASPPRVPDRFRWRDEAAAADGPPPEVRVMYQPGGYGSVQVVPGTGAAVAVDLTGDNLGPPSAQDVVDTFAALSRRFPGAVVEASTFDAVAEVMAAAEDLPVVTGELGDTWVHGVASDPTKTAAFRALCRQRAGWIARGDASADVPALAHASTRLLLVAEHTWGLDQKTHWPEEGHWSVEELAAVRGEPRTARFEGSWAEQRAYLDDYVAELARGGREDLAARARSALDAARHVEPVARGDAPSVEPGRPVRVGGLEVELAADGSLTGLRRDGGDPLASPEHPLGAFHLQTFDAADFERWFTTYNSPCTPEDEWWARWDNTKPGMERSGAVSRRWLTRLTDAWLAEVDGREALVASLEVDVRTEDHDAPVTVPGRMQLVVTEGSGVEGSAADEVCIELRWFDLPAARWPVAWWWRFDPMVVGAGDWSMVKLGEEVSPYDVVAGGARSLHAVERIRHRCGLELEPLDAPLVAPGEPRALHWRPDEPVDLRSGWHVLVHANLWGTNFPMWAEGDGRARVVVRAATNSRR